MCKSDPQVQETVLRTYKRRWIIIGLFVVYSAINAAQWIEYAIIASTIMKYYGVSSTFVEWTSIVYMAIYAPLVLPASYIVNKTGLRIAGLIGGLGTAFGTIVKLFSIRRDLFWVVFLGQLVLAISQTVMTSLPARLAATWFGAEQISTATALCFFGMYLGTAIGFILPGLIVKNSENLNEIANDLYKLTWVFSGIMIPIAIAILLYFPNQPPLPPNQAQLLERTSKTKFDTRHFLKTFKDLLLDCGYIIHTFAFALNIGGFSAFSTLLGQYIEAYFPNNENDAGKMGMVLIVTEMFGSLSFGYFLDKSHRFKESCVFNTMMSFVGTIGLLLALELQSRIWVYIFIVLTGYFVGAYGLSAFEMAPELSYPISEMTATGVILAISQMSSVFFTMIASWVLANYGAYWSLISLIVLLIIALITSFVTPNRLKRQAILRNQNGNYEAVTTDIEKPGM